MQYFFGWSGEDRRELASAAQFLARHNKLCCSKIAPKDAPADCEAQMRADSLRNI